MDMINSKIINDKNVKKNLSTQLNKTEQISTVYTLTKTIRFKILFIHKEFIKTLDTKDILDNMTSLPCICTSPFTDPNYGHIVTGDITIA